jgi:alkylation response protein AidB-like acyl-CoA dehydrogenase
MGPVEGMVVMEELGRGIVLEPFAQTLIAGGGDRRLRPGAVKESWLPRIAGEGMVVLAYQERKARYRLDVCEATAVGRATWYSLTGAKSVVPVGDQADAFIVPAKLDGKIALFLVERSASGVSARGYGTQDGSRAAEVVFDKADATLVTADGLAALEHAVDIGIAALCAEAVGVMDKTVAVTVEYMNTRKQFGVVISSFQALRHRVADMKMQLELARSMSYYASLKLNAPADERRQRAGARQVPAGRVDALRGQPTRCSCTAASA